LGTSPPSRSLEYQASPGEFDPAADPGTRDGAAWVR
jgi:hypothetical protein